MSRVHVGVSLWVTRRFRCPIIHSGGSTFSFPCPRWTKIQLHREISPPYNQRASILPSPVQPTKTKLFPQAKKHAHTLTNTPLHGTVEYMSPSDIQPAPKTLWKGLTKTYSRNSIMPKTHTNRPIRFLDTVSGFDRNYPI